MQCRRRLRDRRGGPTIGQDRPSPSAHQHGSLQLLELGLKTDNLAERITGKDRAGLVEKYTREFAVSREIDNFSFRMEISTLKSELNTIERHVRVLTSSVFLGHDDHDELFLDTGS
jgi:hypothetical protein